jgi:hypothetical protein
MLDMGPTSAAGRPVVGLTATLVIQFGKVMFPLMDVAGLMCSYTAHAVRPDDDAILM